MEDKEQKEEWKKPRLLAYGLVFFSIGLGFYLRFRNEIHALFESSR